MKPKLTIDKAGECAEVSGELTVKYAKDMHVIFHKIVKGRPRTISLKPESMDLGAIQVVWCCISKLRSLGSTVKFSCELEEKDALLLTRSGFNSLLNTLTK